MRLGIAASLLAFVAGLCWPVAQASLSERFTLLLEVRELIESKALQSVSQQSLLEGATEGLLKALNDPYSAYLPPQKFSELTQEKSGQLVGLGFELAYRDQEVLIMSVLEQTPAAEADLRSGDKILAIDGKEIQELDWAGILERLQGNAGSSLSLKVLPIGSAKSRELRLTRRLLNLQAVSFQALPLDLCSLRIQTFFNENLAQDVLERLAEDAASCAGGLILDLRNNPGGLLQQAVALAGQLGVSGTVVQIVSRDGQTEQVQAEAESLLPDSLPMVVLINQGTASAAEVLAAALQESGRAIVMGEPSFGKGLVQSLLPLGDGSGLSLTTHRYLTRLGNNLHQVGIHPDLPQIVAGDSEQLLKQAQFYLLSTLDKP